LTSPGDPLTTAHLDASLDDALAQAAALLRGGSLVAIPTETVYGLAADALNATAVAAIFAAKRRPSFDPLIVHVARVEDVAEVAYMPADATFRALASLWPGPLTLVLPRRAHVPALVSSGLDSIAVRIPNHPVARALIARAGRPLAAPSANLFGSVSPTTAAAVLSELDGRIAAVVDAGPCRIGVESTVISLLGDRPTLLRHGGTPIETLEALVGPIPEGTRVVERPLGPGQLARHYATATPLQVFSDAAALDTSSPDFTRERALLIVDGPSPALAPRYARTIRLTPTSTSADPAPVGDPLVGAAANLFEAMRALDASGSVGIDVVGCEERGIGRAIMDRLRRASVAKESR